MIETVVIDANVAIKWVITEEGTEQALQLRERYHFAAPDLILAECANILWKKVQHGQATEALATASIEALISSQIEIVAMDSLAATALALSLQMQHPAYDCFYLSLALARDYRFVTADARLLRAVWRQGRALAPRCVSLEEAVA